MKTKITLSLLALTITFNYATAQIDTTLLKRVPKDTIKKVMNMDAIYNRPFLSSTKLPVSLGGYLETNWQHLSTNGVSQGNQFQFRRMSLFIASSIAKRIKFLSEIEFENDPNEVMEGKPSEVEVEYAALDFEFHHLLNLRGGMILNPIGAFNQNHDGPKWEFVDRPIAMTQMLPATWSNTGFGLYGKQYSKNWMFGYEFYLTGGFNSSIIDNDRNKTYLPEAKESAARFATTESGEPLVTSKIAVRRNKIGELGLSYMGGAYNKYQQDGLIIDNKRRLDVMAIDFNTSIPKLRTTITTEWAWIFIQVPDTYTQQYGTRQHGGFMDIVQPVLKRRMFGWENAVLNVACRVEYVDWNVGTFKQTGGNIAEDLWSVMPAISFRPTQQTVLRLNYRFQQQRDILGNSPDTTGGFLFGISTYF
jgi:hypothetical protein